MAVNVKLLTERWQKIQEGKKASEFSQLIWKPKDGTQKVRIVPYKFNPEDPFIELKFYYKLAGGNYLAPCTDGLPDPVLEVHKKLSESGSDEDKAAAQQLPKPTARYYVPVIVRGEEERGVRFWGFGPQVYNQLLPLTIDPDWGDITSLTEGNDLKVEFKKVGSKKNPKTGEAFPETTITPLPAKTPAVDPKRKDLMEKVANQTNIRDIFPMKSYDELKGIVTKFLFQDSTPAEEETVLTPEQEAKAAAQVAGSPSAEASATATPKGSASEEFEEFFKKA